MTASKNWKPPSAGPGDYWVRTGRSRTSSLACCRRAVECERSAEVARDTLGAVIGEEPGLRGIRTANNELAPNWTTSQSRWWGTMNHPDAIARLQLERQVFREIIKNLRMIREAAEANAPPG